MIEPKDASTSDERHVNKIANTNLLTQKKTGGKSIMGNQGMKKGMASWKLTVFYTVALMLVTGLFGTVAIADDGDGVISVQGSATGADDSFVNVTGDGFYVPVGANSYRLRFTYTTVESTQVGDTNNSGKDMSEGIVKIEIPTTKGWAVTASSLNPQPVITSNHTDTAATDKDATARYENNYKEVRIYYPKTTLTGDNIGNDLPDSVVVTIIVNAPVKRETVTFKTSSRARGVSLTQGFFKELTVVDGTDADTLPDPASPKIRVGALDTVTVTSNPLIDDALANFVNANTNVTLTFTIAGTSGQLYRVTIPEDWVRYTSSEFTTIASPQQIKGTTIGTVYVKTPNGRGKGIFTTESAPPNTELYTRLDTAATNSPVQPAVTVGNISAGQGMIEISESDLYQGNTYTNVKITFTAAGPMDSDPSKSKTVDNNAVSVQSPGIGITVPTGITVSDLTSSKGTPTITSNTIRLPVTGLGRGDTIVLTAGSLSVADNATAMATIDSGTNQGKDTYSSSFEAFTDTTSFSNTSAVSDSTATALERDPFNTSGPGNTATPVEITGGKIRAQAGSGKLEIVSPKIVEKGSKNVTLEIKYTAVSNLSSQNVVFTLPSEFTLTTGSSGSKATDDVDNSDPTFSLTNRTVAWNPLPAGRDQGVTATITKVTIPSQPGDYNVTLTVGGTAGKSAPITVVGTGEDVDFEIVDLSDGSSDPSPSYPALSRQEIGFKFTARNTKVTEGGKFEIKLPNLWTSPSTTASSGRAQVKEVIAEGAKAVSKLERPLTVSGRTITYTFGKEGLAIGQSVTIQYGIDPDGDKDYRAKMPSVAGDVQVEGHFLASDNTGFETYLVREMAVTITNVKDGHGTASIRPTSVEAGSDDNKITVTFRASGAMGGGRVSLQIPAGWGEMQNVSSTNPNYVTVTSRVKGVKGNYDDLEDFDADSRVIAELPEGFGAGDAVTFTYGGDPGSAEANAVAQDRVADYASFIIESDGDGDGDFAKLTSETPATTGTHGLGKIYKDADGQLRVQVKSATAGVGTASVSVATSKGGSQQYRLDDGTLGSKQRVHAGDDETYLKFTYNPEQDITDGKLELTIPNTWSEPQDDTTGKPGYIRFRSTGDLGTSPVFDSSTVTVDILHLEHDEIIEIDYGRGGSGAGAVAPNTAGPSSFSMRVSGGEVSEGVPEPFIRIKSQLTVDVYSQRSGAGTAEVAVGDNEGDLRAGDEAREVEIIYTAIGQIRNGQVKLTVPANWSPTTTADDGDNVQIAPLSAHDGTPTFPADDAKVVIAEGVNLSAGGKLTFIYTTNVQSAAQDDVAFTVAVNGGEGPGEDPVAIAVQPVIDVRAARPGTGDIAVVPAHVDVGSADNDIVFTYTAVGDIFFPTEFTVTVPQGWTSATAGTRAADKGRYTVKHLRGTSTSDIGGVEKLRPENGNMMARVKRNGRVQSGDKIVFTYYNATAPATAEVSEFQMMFDTTAITEGPFEVLVQPTGGATQIGFKPVATLSVDETVQMPVMVTVELQAADGSAATAAADVTVTLSSDSSTGMFSATADGTQTATTMVTIAAGRWLGMAYYSDSTLGTHTITATATGYTDGTAAARVSTDVPGITSVTFTVTDSAGSAKTAAKDGDKVNVTAMANRDQTLTFTIGTSIVTGGGSDLTESTTSPGTYTGSHTLAAGSPDGSHKVTAHSGAEMMDASAMLIVDNTAPTVTASASPATVANGAEVMISATVGDGTGSGVSTVTADVSMLDTGATAAVTLTDADGDGTYIGSHMISATNTAANGEQTITVTAMDVAGNSSVSCFG